MFKMFITIYVMYSMNLDNLSI